MDKHSDEFFIHGFAKVKKIPPNSGLVLKQCGLVTAWLPDNDTFAVIWGEMPNWHTYKWPFKKIEEYFDILLDDDPLWTEEGVGKFLVDVNYEASEALRRTNKEE